MQFEVVSWCGEWCSSRQFLHRLVVHYAFSDSRSFSSPTLCSWCGKWSFGYCLQCCSIEKLFIKWLLNTSYVNTFGNEAALSMYTRVVFLDIIDTTLFKHALSPPNSSEEPTYSRRALVILLCGLSFRMTPRSFGRSDALPMSFCTRTTWIGCPCPSVWLGLGIADVIYW